MLSMLTGIHVFVIDQFIVLAMVIWVCDCKWIRASRSIICNVACARIKGLKMTSDDYNFIEASLWLVLELKAQNALR